MSEVNFSNNKKKSASLILILGAITTIGPLAIDMYLPAFAAIAESLNASESLVQLSLTSYFIGIICGQILYGPIVDRFGKKLPLFFGLSLFILASILCCFAHNINELIFLRFFQAIGACASVIIPRALVRDIFPPQDSARVFSHLISVMGIAPILAPSLGGLILSGFDWRGIFAFLVLFGIFCLTLSYLALPQGKGADANVKFSQTFKKYRDILRDRTFVISAVSGGLAMAAVFGYISISPFIYLKLFNLSAQEYGFVFGANSIFFVIAAQINATLLKKFPLEMVLKKTLIIPAISGLILIAAGLFHPTFFAITIALGLTITSVGAIIPNTTALALSNQSAHSGSASALLGVIQFIFATCASFLGSKIYDGGALPLALIVGVCGILSCLVFKSFEKRQ